MGNREQCHLEVTGLEVFSLVLLLNNSSGKMVVERFSNVLVLL